MVKWVEFPDGYGRWNAYRLDSIVAVIDVSSDYDDDPELVSEDPLVTNTSSMLIANAPSFDSYAYGWVGASKDSVLSFLIEAERATEVLVRFPNP